MSESSSLFVPVSTLDCATQQHCIPCLYKICTHGSTTAVTADDASSPLLPPNVRPELCPRARTFDSRSYTGLYTCAPAQSRILTVGDGDLSFSLSIAQYFYNFHGTARHIVATTHESYESICATYKEGKKHIDLLQRLGTRVFHRVDATDLTRTLPVSLEDTPRPLVSPQDTPHNATSQRTPHKTLTAQDTPHNATSQDASHNTLTPQDTLSTSDDEKRFHFVLWNFPCIRVEKGADGQVSELEQNKTLIRRFFANIGPYLVPGKGEVHLAHKTIEPFSWWGIEDLAREQGFVCLRRIVFDRCNYPGYVNRKVLDKKSFPSNDALVYVFQPQSWVNEQSTFTHTTVADDDDEQSKAEKKKSKKDKKDKKKKKDKKDKHDEKEEDNTDKKSITACTHKHTSPYLDELLPLSDPTARRRIYDAVRAVGNNKSNNAGSNSLSGGNKKRKLDE